MLQVHTIKASPGSKHSKKRVGRGNASGHGTSSTRGGKGQTARSGGSRGLRLKAFKALMQSAPKLRGFKSPHVRPVEVYLSDIDAAFDAGDTVDLTSLQEKDLVSINTKTVKIVSTGDIKKKVIAVGLLVTKGAADKIKQAGGEVK